MKFQNCLWFFLLPPPIYRNFSEPNTKTNPMCPPLSASTPTPRSQPCRATRAASWPGRCPAPTPASLHSVLLKSGDLYKFHLIMPLPFKNLQRLLVNPRINSRLINLAIKALCIWAPLQPPTTPPHHACSGLNDLPAPLNLTTLYLPPGYYNSSSGWNLNSLNLGWRASSGHRRHLKCSLFRRPPLATQWNLPSQYLILIFYITTYHNLGILFTSLATWMSLPFEQKITGMLNKIFIKWTAKNTEATKFFSQQLSECHRLVVPIC